MPTDIMPMIQAATPVPDVWDILLWIAMSFGGTFLGWLAKRWINS